MVSLGQAPRCTLPRSPRGAPEPPRRPCARVPMLTTMSTYRLYSNNLERSLETTSKQPQVSRESKYYLDNITKVKSIDDFLKDKRLFSFAMQAFGLNDMVEAKAYMRKVLKEGIDDPQSFANTLTDKRFKEFASEFNFARYGEATTVFERTRQGTVDRYVRLTLESQVGQTSEGAQLALYFKRKAPGITSVYGLLADKSLISVVQTALGLDPSTSLMPIDKQAKLIASRLDIKDLGDPQKLEKFMTRFTTLWDLNSGSTAASVPLLIGTQRPVIGVDILQSLQRLKLGG